MKIFTIATAHLDTSWNWTLEETIKYLIKPTFEKNIKLFQRFPNYRFNFEGSYRYELLKEYYPESFEKIKKYISDKKFNVTGSCYENGDVNIVSSESLIRNILYGNSFFYNEFKTRSNDIFLPDCFGFGKALPSIISHCGLKGFSTQKLTWGSKNGIPFEIGKWNGIDNKPVYISIDGGMYGNILNNDIREKYRNKIVKNKINDLDFTMVYHGTGDRGGTPHIKSIKALEKAINENIDHDIEVVASTPSEFFDYIETIDKTNKLPVFDDEFLMSTHGVGSYTSRTQMKRFNKRCEVLADLCERANSLSYLLGYKYPDKRLDFAWKKTIQHHFHDDITGTSFAESYKRGYNDYVQALNIFESEYKNAILNITEDFDTSKVIGIPVVVFNGCQDDSFSIASIKIKGLNGKAVKVINSNFKEVKSQVNNDIAYFKDNFKGNSLSLYDVQIQDKNYEFTNLENTKKIENTKYIISFDDEYSIESIYDKKLEVELLKSKIDYELINDITFTEYPSWEINYLDIIRKPYAYPKFKSFRVLEHGDLFTQLEIIKTYNNSNFKTIITLEEDSERIDIFNEIDWAEEATMLKIKFDLNVINKYASYDIGFGHYKRDNNTEKKYEVPAQRFVDIEDENKNYGISILSDSRTGYDKPNDTTIRLTAIHTPLYNYRYESSQHLQDIGINRFSYSIFSHSKGLDKTTSEAEKFVKNIQAFEINKHNGSINELKLISINNPNVRISAIKKAHDGDELIVRVYECSGNNQDNVSIMFNNKILKAYECYGDERIINEISPNITFSLKPFEIKSFRIKLEINKKELVQKYLDINCDLCGITTNNNRNDATTKNQISLPQEMTDEIVSSCSVDFKLKKYDKLNVLSCKAQTINIDSKFKYANILMINLGNDKKIKINDNEYYIQSSLESLGCWDLVSLNKAGYIKKIPQDYTVTHYHNCYEDKIAENIYLYNIIVPIDNEMIRLPDDDDLYIYAITLNNRGNNISCLKMYDQLDKRALKYSFSEYAIKKAKKPKYQKLLDLFLNRRRIYKYVSSWGYTSQSLSDIYFTLFDLKSNLRYAKRLEKDKNNN